MRLSDLTAAAPVPAAVVAPPVADSAPAQQQEPAATPWVPAVGDRVRRGFTWQWGTQDHYHGVEQAGEIIELGRDNRDYPGSRWYRIRWDSNDRTDSYLYGGERQDFVLVTPAPAVVEDPDPFADDDPAPAVVVEEPKPVEKKEETPELPDDDYPAELKVGMMVRRGRDWSYGNQDFTNGKPGKGRVIGVGRNFTSQDGTIYNIEVMWGNTASYYYAYNDAKKHICCVTKHDAAKIAAKRKEAADAINSKVISTNEAAEKEHKKLVEKALKGFKRYREGKSVMLIAFGVPLYDLGNKRVREVLVRLMNGAKSAGLCNTFMVMLRDKRSAAIHGVNKDSQLQGQFRFEHVWEINGVGGQGNG